jgi:hypothetical protein
MEKLTKLNEVIDYIVMTKALTFTEVIDLAREWVEKGEHNV